jgi:hypothetical protein
MFADNTACIAILDHPLAFINSELTKMATWSSTNKMAVNVNKTKLIAFHTKDKPFPENRIKIFIMTINLTIMILILSLNLNVITTNTLTSTAENTSF